MTPDLWHVMLDRDPRSVALISDPRHWEGSQVRGQGSVLRVRGQGSWVRGQGSVIMCHGLEVKGHGSVTLDWPVTPDQWPLTTDQWPWPLTRDPDHGPVTADHDHWLLPTDLLPLIPELWPLSLDPWSVTLARDHWPLIPNPWPWCQGSVLRGHGSDIMGKESRVSDKGSQDKGHGSRVTTYLITLPSFHVQLLKRLLSSLITHLLLEKYPAQYCTIKPKVDVSSIRFPCSVLYIEYIKFHCDIFQLQL